MDDNKYFDQYKKSCEVIFAAHPSDYTYIKDINFKYQTMTNGMLSLIGANSFKDIENLTTSEIVTKLNLPYAKFIEKFHTQDLSVAKAQKRGAYLEIMPNMIAAPGAHVSKLLIIYKTPIINPETNATIGIHGQVSDLLWPNVLKTMFKLHGTKGLLLNHVNKHDNLNDYPLTNMQHMVLFLCINNYSYSEIALFLNEFGNSITPSRVNDYLEQLKLIFHVRTKAQLIEKAIGLNFHVMLPCDLFNTPETIKINTETALIICCNCKLGNCSDHKYLNIN